MRRKPRRLTAALVVFSLFFQLLPLPALANGGRRDLIRASASSGALHASLKTDVSSSQSGSIQPIPSIQPIRTSAAPVPTANITAPADASVVTAPTKIIGTATADSMTKYTLAYAPVQTRNVGDSEYKPVEYVVFATGTRPVSGGVLGVFDPTLLPNGYYTVRLTVEGGGAQATKEITVSVEGELKVGSFSMSFIDMDMPIHGIPLSVVRTYDSREKDRSGRFGFGWDMKLTKATLSENGTPGSKWTMTRSDSGWLKGYTMVQEKPHEVVVHWGNGRMDKFALNLQPTFSLFPIRWLRAYYENINDTKSRLESLDQSTDLLYQSGVVYDYDFKPFNPRRYRLTAVDGTVYVLNDQTGLESVKSANGDVVTITADGVTHSDGKSIVFERDGRKRITKISGPTGRSVTYGYDDKGDLVSVTDVGGNETKLGYDGSHLLTGITDPRGVRAARNEYDAEGRLIATVDASGRRIAYAHNLDGRRSTVTDRLGNTTLYVYDDRGNVLSVTDGNGHTTTHTYDENGRRSTTTDALGNTTQYRYTKDGRLLSMTNALGLKVENAYTTKNELLTVHAFGVKQAEFAYDGSGQLTQITDALGNVKRYEYLGGGRPKSITDAIGTVMQFTYDSSNNVSSTTNGAGETATFAYDKDGNAVSKTLTRSGENGANKVLTETYQYDVYGNVTRTVYPDGTFVAMEYDVVGNRTAMTDSSGRRTTFEYDVFRNLTKANYFDGTTELFEYDVENRNVRATDRLGQTVVMAYDNVGNLLSKTYGDGSSERFAYDAKNRLTTKTDRGGATTTYVYDAIDRNTSITNALGNRTEFEYDGSSRLVRVKDPRGNVTSYEYDANGNRTKAVLADGSTLTTAYDARGRIVRQTDQNGHATAYQYDGLDRLTGVVDALGREWTYRYNTVGELTSVTDPAGNKTAYEYDDRGRQVKTVNAAGQERRTRYDARGNVESVTDFSGAQTLFGYDAKDRLTRIAAGGKTTTFVHDALGRIETVTDENGITRHTYDAEGRLTSERKPDGSVLSYEYDAAGRVLRLTTPYGSTTSAYDVLGRPKTVTDRDGSVTSYEYDANGNLTKVAYSNGLTTAYAYNAVNALTGERITDRNGAVVAEYAYTVGRAGERLGASESGRSGNRTVTYTYDALYRLTGETTAENGRTTVRTYAYDAAGNRVSRTVDGVTTTYAYNRLNQLTGETGITYAYDGNGNRTRKAAGTRTTTYAYDGFNRLVRATVQEGANVAVEEYGYDWKGNRIRKSREGNTVRYLVDTNNWISHVVAETDGTGTLRAFYTRGGDSLIAMDRGGVKSWYLYDGHGSVRMLANGMGQTTDTWTYDAWGETTSRTGVTENDYLYAGERFDRTTELYQLRARYMDPKTGTFLSLDPHQGNRHDPASLHKYMYANANPVNNVDPTGLTSIAEMSGAMAGQGILAGASGLNFWTVLGLIGGRAKAIVGATIALSLLTEKFMESALNGEISFVGLLGMLRRAILDSVAAPHKANSHIIFSQNLFTLKEIQDAFGRITDNDWNHYLQDHHDLHKLPFDPKDPNNREKLLAIISAVLAQGKESLYKNTTDIFLRSLEILPQVIFEVKYTFVEGVLRISDIWIKRN